MGSRAAGGGKSEGEEECDAEGGFKKAAHCRGNVSSPTVNKGSIMDHRDHRNPISL
ncbi:unnamed protein product [Tetraodon nigroviridis]|uniref:(spotted green pufferfish) hypothetical protein n=1 Tax=Tetraodon nigroviridis TaxID=99883 RepID=Q4RHW5_TETNG|nr:unnamed protein product [Tetraodon nigroviridis]